jgi:hypothetical protein
LGQEHLKRGCLSQFKFHVYGDVAAQELEGVESRAKSKFQRKLPAPGDAGREGIATDAVDASVRTKDAGRLSEGQQVEADALVCPGKESQP